MKIALDANRYSDFCRGLPEAVETIQRADQLFLPFVVVAELRAGFLAGTAARANEKLLREFLRSPRAGVVYADDATTLSYAALVVQLRRAGTPIPTNDLWIAALVLQNNLHLYSRDRHFNRIPQLSLI